MKQEKYELDWSDWETVRGRGRVGKHGALLPRRLFVACVVAVACGREGKCWIVTLLLLTRDNATTHDDWVKR